MTTEPEIEPGAGEPLAPPVPAFSSGVSESATTSSDVDYDQLAEKLAPKIEALVDKRFQSGKDKRFDAVDKIAKYLAASGGDVAKATREMALDEFIASGGQQPSSGGGGTAPRETPEQVTQKVQAEVGELLTEAGIAFDDPDYVGLTKKDYTSPAQFQKDVTRLIAKRAKQAHNPGPAAGAGDGAGRTPLAEASTNRLKQEYRQRVTPLRGNIQAIQELKREFRAKGLNDF